jgi:hypothetical protein
MNLFIRFLVADLTSRRRGRFPNPLEKGISRLFLLPHHIFKYNKSVNSDLTLSSTVGQRNCNFELLSSEPYIAILSLGRTKSHYAEFAEKVC